MLLWVTARAQLVSRVKRVRLMIDTTNKTSQFAGHPYQTPMYQVRISDDVLCVQMNQSDVPQAKDALGEVVEWVLTPAIAQQKETQRIEEEREMRRRWEKEARRREKEWEKERRHRELMKKLG